MDTQNILTKIIIDKLMDILKTKKKVLSSLLGVTPTTLSMSVDRPFSEIKTKKLGKRLSSLLYVVETLSKDSTLSPEAMLHILTIPKYSMSDGTYLDVVSAIHLGTIQNEFLIVIADVALESLREKYKKDKKPSEKGLYSQVMTA